MIPELFIEQWQKNAPWQTLAMVEQDLVISRALVNLYSCPDIQKNLIFRGGTALNKMYINPPARYSEDIDLVQLVAEPIGKSLDLIRSVLDPWLGEPKRKLTERSAKLVYRYISIDNTPSKLKIEINTTEHFNVLPIKSENHCVDSEWFNGESIIRVYQLEELMGTKLRALYQRRKGRDLFDLWYAIQNKLINVETVIEIFNKYCAYNNNPITRFDFEKNLESKKQHRDFLMDIKPLLVSNFEWDFNRAVNLVEQEIIHKL
jgi:predicted nucleotidyltransferase component of viral defense system